MDFGMVRELRANKHVGSHKNGSTFIQNDDLNLEYVIMTHRTTAWSFGTQKP